MTRPVTSTSVATNGAELTAGSAPNLFKIRGSIDPVMVPQSTTPTRDTPTLIATNNQ